MAQVPEAESVAVVGSGPAAAAAVSALLKRGCRVTVLDLGHTLEPDRDALKQKLAEREPEQWTPEMVSAARGDYRCTPEGLEVKRQFGSDYSTRYPANGVSMEFDKVEHIPSFAFGGLSNIWGAAVLPYRPEDIKDWPLTFEELRPHYEAAVEITGSTGRRGDPLDQLFPCICQSPEALPLSRSSTGLLKDMERQRASLVKDGMHYGMARVAMRAEDRAEEKGCRECGLCMHGCPYDLIFSSAHPFAKWIAEGALEYRAGCLVRRFEQKGHLVEVEYSTADGVLHHRPFSRLFMASGVIPTTKIVLASLGEYDVPVLGKDSHYFLFPMFRMLGSGNVRKERLQTLSQIFVDIVDPVLDGKTTHVQLYSYSDIIDASIQAMLGPLRALAKPVLSRLMIAQAFLHSDFSANLQYELRRGAGGEDTLRLKSVENPESARARQHILWKFARHSLSLRTVPGIPFVKIGNPGRSLHCGSTFPMARQPGRHQTDILGCLPGIDRVHLVDSTVLPSIPGTTITLSAMANAHRIASTWSDV